MIDRNIFYRIHYLHKHEKLSPGQIAEEIGISESTVRRRIAQSDFNERKERSVPLKLDRYTEHIRRLLDDFPGYTATQIFQMLREDGFEGSYSTVRRMVAKARPPVKKTYMRLNFSPGEAAQVDFGSCGTIQCGNTQRRLSVFVMVMCYSRYIYAEFIPCERQEHFLCCHREAFADFRGVPERVIVDNCKCAVLSNRRYEKAVYNPRYLDFAASYGFRPDACNPGQPHEKGIVENAVGYIKKNFVAGRRFSSLKDANFTLRSWLDSIANVRVHGATGKIPLKLLEEERGVLGKLPFYEPDCSVKRSCRADSRCRIWFDSNSYSVPERCAGIPLTLSATSDMIRIYMDGKSVARHVRSYDRKQDIVNPDHQRDVRRARKRAALQNMEKDFLKIGSKAEEFLTKLELKEVNTEMHMRKILAMTDIYGRKAVAAALGDLLEFGVFRAEYVEQKLLMASADKPQRGTLHVPRAEDMLNLKIEQPDMKLYDLHMHNKTGKK